MKNRSGISNIVFIFENIREFSNKIFNQYILCTLARVFIIFPSIIFPFLLIDNLIKEPNLSRIILILTTFGISMTILNCINTYFDSFEDSRSTFVRFNFLSVYYKKCMTIDYKYTEDPNIINSVEKICTIVNGRDRGILGIVDRTIELLSNSITLLIFILILSRLNIIIPLIIIILNVIVFLFQNKAKMFEYRNEDTKNKLLRKLRYLYGVMYSINYAKEVRSYNLQEFLTNKFNKAIQEYISNLKEVRKRYIYAKISDFITMFLRECVIYILLIYEVINNRIQISEFFMYMMLINLSTGLIKKIFDNIVWIRSENLVIGEYRDFLELEDDVVDKTMKHKLINIDEKIRIVFENVWFKYPNTKDYILKNINLKIESGEKLAIVGDNGAGKTTLVKLLCKMFEPTKGRILINDIDIHEFTKKEYYQLLSVVFQDFKSFAFTVEENITTQIHTDYEKLEEAISKSGLKDKIERLPCGIHSNIDKELEPDGVILSGGENQKLALARAIYKEGKIFILDEPTSALDPLAESRLYERFSQVTKDNTTIFISHRLASTKFCDRIVVLSKGEISEMGSHDTLINANGLYANMFEVQAHYYKEEEAYE